MRNELVLFDLVWRVLIIRHLTVNFSISLLFLKSSRGTFPWASSRSFAIECLCHYHWTQIVVTPREFLSMLATINSLIQKIYSYSCGSTSFSPKLSRGSLWNIAFSNNLPFPLSFQRFFCFPPISLEQVTGLSSRKISRSGTTLIACSCC